MSYPAEDDKWFFLMGSRCQESGAAPRPAYPGPAPRFPLGEGSLEFLTQMARLLGECGEVPVRGQISQDRNSNLLQALEYNLWLASLHGNFLVFAAKKRCAVTGPYRPRYVIDLVRRSRVVTGAESHLQQADRNR